MNRQSLAFAAVLAAAMTLAACGGGDDDEEPGDDAAAAAVTPEPDPPGMVAAAGVLAAEISLTDLVGVWAETAGECGTIDELVIAPDAFLVGEEACLVTGLDAVEGGLQIQLLCPVEDAALSDITWTVAAFGDAPFTEITITDGDATTPFARCIAVE